VLLSAGLLYEADNSAYWAHNERDSRNIMTKTGILFSIWQG